MVSDDRKVHRLYNIEEKWSFHLNLRQKFGPQLVIIEIC